MTVVQLEGLLVCHSDEERARVVAQLAQHILLTRAEPGCLSFDVDPTDDPLTWTVSERFADSASFRAHQERAATSIWGEATVGLERRYTVTGLRS